MSTAKERYESGHYNVEFGDDRWKAEQMLRLLENIPDPKSISSYADVGCGNGEIFTNLRDAMVRKEFPIQSAVGYDIIPEEKFKAQGREGIVFKRADFFEDDEVFDLITLNDVIEHVTRPLEFCTKIGQRARYVALHIPLDDRLSVLCANQFNYRLKQVGHISFWSPATALNTLTAAGLLPIHCCFTPGFRAPSGRERTIQRIAYPFRWLMWSVSPGLMSATIGGTSLAVLCRGSRS